MKQKYAVVVKKVTKEMMHKAYGINFGKEPPKLGTVFIIHDQCLSSSRIPSFYHNECLPFYDYIIPVEWCMELTEEEYLVFKKLAEKDKK